MLLGDWSSVAIAEQYADETIVRKQQIANLLVCHSESAQLENPPEKASATSQSHVTITFNNCQITTLSVIENQQ